MELEDDIQDRSARPSFSSLQRWTIGLHVFLSSVAFLVLIGMLNYLGHRHNQRLYLSRAAAHKLTPLTLRVLGNLGSDVKVTVFFDRREPLFGSVANLIKEYESRSPRLEVEFVDYRMPGRAEAIRTQYKLAMAGDTSRIIFDAGGQVRTILSTELSEFGITPENEIRRIGFRGEQMFTSAILNVTQAKMVTAYFLQGHGEQSPVGDEDRGYSRFARMLENNNVRVKTIGPLVATEIPEDCGLLICAGPERQLEADELTKIQKYLEQGGRALFLFSSGNGRFVPTGLERMLAGWSIQVGFDLAQDPAQSQSSESAVLLTSNFGAHPIVRTLLRSSVALVAPRSVAQRPAPATSADAPKVTEILSTTSSGYTLVPREKDWRKEREGTIPLAVAAERGAIPGVAAERGASRLVAVGDSLFLSNLVFSHAANGDFGNMVVNWLINRDSLLNEIGPSAVSEYQILLTEQQMSQLRWLFLGAIPGGVATFGFFVWLRRRV
jgi:hypothetical protein